MKFTSVAQLVSMILLVSLFSVACSNLQGVPDGDGEQGDTPNDSEDDSIRVHLESEFEYEATGIEELAMHEVLSLSPISMEAGEQALIEGRAHVEGPVGLDQPILVSTRISCRRSDVGFAQGVWTWRNWEGDDRRPDGVVVSVRDVFTAPEPGAYICSLELLSGAGLGLPDDTFMTAKRGTDKTWLSFTPHPSSGQTHWAEDDHFDIDTEDTGTALEHTFTLPDPGGDYTIISDVQLSSCPPGAIARGWCSIDGTTDVSNVESRLYVLQLENDGVTECRKWSYPPAGANPASLAIPNALHHAKAFHDLSFSADPTCSSTVTSWVEVEVVSGNPVRVEDQIGSGTLTIGGAIKTE